MFKHLIYVCTNIRNEKLPKPSCGPRGSKEILEKFKSEITLQGLADSVEIEESGCLGACEDGSTVLVHTDQTWYGAVHVEDVSEIVRSHFIEGIPVKRLFIKRLMTRRLFGS